MKTFLLLSVVLLSVFVAWRAMSPPREGSPTTAEQPAPTQAAREREPDNLQAVQPVQHSTPARPDDSASRQVLREELHGEWVEFFKENDKFMLGSKHREFANETVARLGVSAELAELVTLLGRSGYPSAVTLIDNAVKAHFLQHPEAAVDFAQRVEEPDNSMNSLHLQKWISYAGAQIQLPEDALETEQLSPRLRQQLRYGMAKGLAARDPDAALALLREVNAAGTPSATRSDSVRDAVSALPEDANYLQLAESFFDSPSTDDAWRRGAEDFYRAWTDQDALAAASFVLSQEPGEWSDRMLGTVMEKVARQNTEQAIDWLKQFDDERTYSKAAESIVYQIAQSRPEDARKITATIPSQDTQAKLYELIQAFENKYSR
ncbi:hypothetical protein SAMN02745181_0380 [Rubritalea squalenifaciens DSM 18772]|uniref:HEAT repeat-containing protein n=1 Tax=Rubritalea squalenifaciens DSM 18772 TaxID=1123071 RepID=A0A1M6C3T9_9BACT|nr:hypothetical protein [Rubritalea squalenifaciens]SHI55659.1 hypothetical protein SAMN02745181_0380 [Rubritalea squalenifaciens DSM 18772]